jgi:hypothetical protein
VVDAGYDVPRLAYQLRDLPVVVIGRLRSDRVLYRAAPAYAGFGRPQRHGSAFRLTDPSTWEAPEAQTLTDTDRYGKFEAKVWEGLHPWLKQRSAWIGHDQTLPVIEGTVIRIQSERLPLTGTPEPIWLWTSAGGIDDELLGSLWSAWLRRFDIEHTFRFLKQTLGWTVSQVRDPEAADRWTWLIIAAFTQLAAVKSLAADLRLPWEAPADRGRLTPARVRRAFPDLHANLPLLTSVPKPSNPGPGRPAGQRNRRKAPIRDPGKKAKRDKTLAQRKQRLTSAQA